jgi:acetylglutamate kinase
MTPPIILKLGGLAVESPDRATTILRAIADTARTTPIIIVHGGGKAVDTHLARLGLTSTRVQGLRVTTDEEIPEVVAVLAGRVNTSIVAALHALGARPVGLTLSDGETSTATRLQLKRATASGASLRTQSAVESPDLGRVGSITSGDPAFLRLLLDHHYLPVLAPIAFDSAGHPLNVNADDAAAAIASILAARLLILLTDVPAVLDAQHNPIAELDRARAHTLIETGVITGGMVPKVRAALGAADRARVPTVIASWNDPDSLTALLKGEARGTRFPPASAPPSITNQKESGHK